MFLSFTALYELASIDGCYDKNVRKFMSTQKAIDYADHAAKWKTFFEAVRPEVAFQLFGGVSLNSEKVAIFASLSPFPFSYLYPGKEFKRGVHKGGTWLTNSRRTSLLVALVDSANGWFSVIVR